MNANLVFVTAENLPGIYDSLFFGFFNHETIFRFAKWAFPSLAVSAIACVIAARIFVRHSAHWLRAARILGWIGVGVSPALFNDPFDEVFLNLRHAQNFVAGHGFSFQSTRPVEATVDFLPYFTLALLGKLGLPLIELVFAQCFVGVVLALAALGRLTEKLVPSETGRTVCFLGLAFYPPITYCSATGFSTAIFSAAILWFTYFLFFGDFRKATVVAALLPLIRIEGALFVALAFATKFLTEGRREATSKNFARHAGAFVLALAPLALLTWYRYRTFHYAVPLPVHFKASLGDADYFRLGLENFHGDAGGAFLFGILATLAISAAVLFRRSPTEFARLRPLGPILAAAFAFILPYYLAGGDWFPTPWARYLLPFSLLAAGSALVAFATAARALPPARRFGFAVAVLAVFGAVSAADHYTRYSIGYFAAHLRQWPRGDWRVNDLSKAGRHLKRVTAPTDRIASSELATISYFAERDAYDLLGVSNPYIISQPLLKPPAITPRRVHPADLIAREMPEIVWPHSFYTDDLPIQFTRADIDQKFTFLESLCREFNQTYFGGIGTLERLNYQPVAVVYGRYLIIYYVSPAALPQHLVRLREQGFLNFDAAQLAQRRSH